MMRLEFLWGRNIKIALYLSGTDQKTIVLLILLQTNDDNLHGEYKCHLCRESETAKPHPMRCPCPFISAEHEGIEVSGVLESVSGIQE